MNISDLKGKKITVMGLGLHGGGAGAVRFLSLSGAKVTVTDIKSKEELKPSLEKLEDLKDITYVLGQHRTEDFSKADMILKNPAASWMDKYVKLAMDNNVPVEMDSSLFFKLCENPIIGVTGTKGKTTTATLIYEILKSAGKDAIKVGIGQASVLDKLEDLKKDTVVVFELSSWRLSALGRSKLSPRVAVVTNIYPDHLNYYKSMEEYANDKKNIFLYQARGDVCVINADNEIVRGFEKEIKPKPVKFSKNKISNGNSVYLENGSIYFNDGVDERKVVDEKDIKLRGEHNLENVMAAVGAAWAAGVELGAIKKAVLKFEGVAHRLEVVRELDGVKYVNDSAATMPEAAISGLNSFSEPVVIIAGGSDKNLNMDEFAKTLAEKAQVIVFLKGAATDKIILAMKKADPSLVDKEFAVADSMEKAVELARREAKEGDVVLLSPGAASFGLFLNEFDRGDKFKEAVKSLK
ncbi:MAG: UDP-N-acetylmuramoylalanine--D-glutamate ligase [Candidatus Moranbacteria bacterium RIFOXYA12_FULL_44_15]|nr:MAG: UDP-N-acetylmuramoylalanine--D-glutamate ligase [Candidatus Moranbacteria bacterium RIFOXYA12_FULL_44_15]OGI34205.1 MAG: UDP-N-acetylmuramoylalanine--D-glutamate ligase [Candidatus Moranbacteria bacterium RIFOXYA2_FULL_43_15]